MKKFFTFLRLILDAARDTKKIIKYFNLIKLNGYSIILKIFYIRFFFSFEHIRNLQKIKKIYKKHKLFFLDDNNNILDIDSISKDIDQIGFSEVFNLKRELVEKIKEYIFSSKNITIKKQIVNKDILLKNNAENLENYFLRLKKLNVSRFTGTLDIKKNSDLKDLLLSKPILDLARSYLNCKTLSVNASFFVSNPISISKQEKYENAQYYHWDNDFTKFFKLYIYLTDVDFGSGPHVYIPGTHKVKLPQHKLCRLYADENINKSYNDKRIFTGKAGSLFFVDSYGIHKGETPVDKSRLMLNVHYGKGKILYSSDDLSLKIN